MGASQQQEVAMGEQAGDKGLRRHTDGGYYRAMGIAHVDMAAIEEKAPMPDGAVLIGQAHHTEDLSMVEVFRLSDGSLMCRVCEGRNGLDQEDLMVYEHLWPFEKLMWTRPLSQFQERFTPITEAELEEAIAGNREAAQTAVKEHKANRRKNQA
jgi:hypothetical protein